LRDDAGVQDARQLFEASLAAAQGTRRSPKPGPGVGFEQELSEVDLGYPRLHELEQPGLQ